MDYDSECTHLVKNSERKS